MNRLTAISLFAAGSLAFALTACSDDPTSAPTTPGAALGATSAASKLIAAPPGAEVIPDSYIVVYNESVAPNAGGLSKTTSSIARQYADVKIEATFDHAIHGFSARIPEARLQSLLADPRVKYIEQDQVFRACSTATIQSLDWGTSYIGADSSSARSGDNTGTVTGVEVYVIDTGIDPNHPDLNVVGGINYGNQLKPQTYWVDEHGHGTHVAGIIGAKDNGAYTVGVAPGVSIYSVRVFGPKGSGSTTNVIKGMNWVAAQKRLKPSTPMVANMSLAGGASLSMDNAFKALVKSGVVTVVAAGNASRLASLGSPTRLDECITVGATASTGAFASFSNYGPKVDILAPGVNILSSKMGGGVTTMSGTSMATPQVAGAAALFMSRNGNRTQAQMQAELVGDAVAWGSALPTGTPNKVLRATTY